MLFLAVKACSNKSGETATKVDAVDTTKSFKIEGYWVAPKQKFEFNALGMSLGDTLHIVTCAEEIFFPFGKLTDKSSLETSLLKDFTIKSFQRDTFTNTNLSPPFFEWFESMEIELDGNKLQLFLDNDPEASTHGYIRGGQIVNGKVEFLNKVKVGMDSQEFYNSFFDHFPIALIKKYKVVKLESCVSDITHIYTFYGDKLKSIKFVRT